MVRARQGLLHIQAESPPLNGPGCRCACCSLPAALRLHMRPRRQRCDTPLLDAKSALAGCQRAAATPRSVPSTAVLNARCWPELPGTWSHPPLSRLPPAQTLPPPAATERALRGPGPQWRLQVHRGCPRQPSHTHQAAPALRRMHPCRQACKSSCVRPQPLPAASKPHNPTNVHYARNCKT